MHNGVNNWFALVQNTGDTK